MAYDLKASPHLGLAHDGSGKSGTGLGFGTF